MNNPVHAILIVTAAFAVCGCISVKTESEIKPIHITMDVNLKVDRELDRSFGGENMSKPTREFQQVRDLLDRKVAGVGSNGFFVARDGASDDDRILIAEANTRRQQRFEQIAKDSGVACSTVQQRSARRFRERLPAGCGVWVQADDGSWSQK